MEQVRPRHHLDKGVIDELRGAAAFHGDVQARQHWLDVRVPEALEIAGGRRPPAVADRGVGLPEQVFDDAGGVDLPRAGKGKEPQQFRSRELPEVLGIVSNALGG